MSPSCNLQFKIVHLFALSELQPLHWSRCDIFIGLWKVWSATAVDPISLTPSNRKSQLCIFIYSFLSQKFQMTLKQMAFCNSGSWCFLCSSISRDWLSGSFSTSILVYSLNISHKTEPDLFQKNQISDEIEPTVCFTLFFIFYISTKVSIMSSINWSNRGFNFTTKLPPKINCW